MTTREDAVRRAAEAMEDAALTYLGRDLGTLHRDDIARAAIDAAVPPGHVVIPADPLAAVLDYILDGQGDLADAMAAAQRLATALDAWMEQP